MKSKFLKRILSLLLVLSFFAGMIPATATVTAVPSLSTAVGESAQNPILISTMDQLIEEMEKDVTSPTYYKLTEDVSHETSIEYMDGREDHTGDDGYNTVRKPQMAQCVVGTGKKFLELDGYDRRDTLTHVLARQILVVCLELIILARILVDHLGNGVFEADLVRAALNRVDIVGKGDESFIDEHMGFIKFGSRVDLYLPIGTKVNVELGQRTTGNETIIAKLS